MAKRPPQRPPSRKTASAGNALSFPVAGHGAGAAGNDGAASAQDTAIDASRLAGDRDQFAAHLGGLRDHGNLSVADEAAILREYDGLLAQLRTERGELEREFRERLGRDGGEDAEAWLRQMAEALGRRQGERMRRLFGTIPAFTAHSAAAG